MLRLVFEPGLKSAIIVGTIPLGVVLLAWFSSGGDRVSKFATYAPSRDETLGMVIGLAIMSYGMAFLFAYALPSAWSGFASVCLLFAACVLIVGIPHAANENAVRAARFEKELHSLYEKIAAERGFVLSTNDSRWVSYDKDSMPELTSNRSQRYMWKRRSDIERAQESLQRRLRVELVAEEIIDEELQRKTHSEGHP